jgi:hypothetical protein
MPTLLKKRFSLTPKRAVVESDYDRGKREVYNTRLWRRLRLARLMEHPLCEVCGYALSVQVHHTDSFMKYEGPERRQHGFDPDNLRAVCGECHRRLHAGS